MNLKFTGGPLKVGDFIAIAYNNNFQLGWYVGTGRGTVQYYNMYAPANVYSTYLQHVKAGDNTNPYKRKLFKDGFTRKSIWKGYINAPHGNRVIKLDNPETILDQETLEIYNKSREALIEAKFIQP